MADEAKCPTCRLPNDDLQSVNCSNAWHLTWEDRIPEPRPYQPRAVAE